jgi:hypothetical protein
MGRLGFAKLTFLLLRRRLRLLDFNYIFSLFNWFIHFDRHFLPIYRSLSAPVSCVCHVTENAPFQLDTDLPTSSNIQSSEIFCQTIPIIRSDYNIYIYIYIYILLFTGGNYTYPLILLNLLFNL